MQYRHPRKTITYWFTLTTVIAAASCPSAFAEVVKLPITRDTWVSSNGRERDGNLGGQPWMKLKGIQEFSLFDIDTRSLRGKTIKSATLHVRTEDGPPLRRVTVSSIASPWVEGSGRRYRQQRGSSSFNWARQDIAPWSFAGSDILSVINGRGNTIWGFADATPPDGDGWQTIAIDPRVMGARVAGISEGFVLFDDVGHEWSRKGEQFQMNIFPNRYVRSRESRDSAPYVTVIFGEDDRTPPGKITNASSSAKGPDGVELPPGEAWLSFDSPNNTIGFEARYNLGNRLLGQDRQQAVPRYMIPVAVSGERVHMHIRGLEPDKTYSVTIKAIDAAGNVGLPSAFTTRTARDQRCGIAELPVKPFDESAPLPQLDGADIYVIDPLDKVQPTTGNMLPPHDAGYKSANHLWSAKEKRIRLHAARNEFVAFQIVAASNVKAKLEFAESGSVAELLRFGHVQSDRGPLPDPLVPMSAKTDEHKTSSFIADVYVPHHAPPGLHRGKLTLTGNGSTLVIRVELNVWQFTLPDFLSFVPQMNCYGLPKRKTEIHYYRMAHKHRTCLNRLTYGWNGRINPRFSPKRLTATEWDWTEYDRNLGPLLDGSAFSDLPRKGVPVDAIYLPLNETWPMKMHLHFRADYNKDSKYWIENTFDDRYWSGFRGTVEHFANHLRDKGWTNTFFEFYLNNKVSYKSRGWNVSSALWHLDEPVNTQDFWALRAYGRAFHQALTPKVCGDVKMAYRCDISRPQWQRDLLDGIIDTNVIGKPMRQYPFMVTDRKRRNGEVVYNYGGSNPITQSNIQPAAWCIDSWTLGADGVIPWQTIGRESAWEKASALSLFYPTPDGPRPSIRLKAYRRGQQDVEYLTLLSKEHGRYAVSQAVRQTLKLKTNIHSTSDDDAGRTSYNQADPIELWKLRIRVGAMLDRMKPAPARQIIRLRTPTRSIPPETRKAITIDR